MFSQIKSILTQSRDTLFYDFGGILVLSAFTVGLLHLPNTI
jgi:hypothetical protein